METVAAIVARALAHHRGGRAAEAAAAYREALAREPRHGDANNLFGQLLLAAGRAAEALPHAETAVAAEATNHRFHNNHALVLRALGRFADAEAACRRALRLKPGYAEGQANLGLVLKSAGRAADAEAALREAVRLDPKLADAHNNLGNLLKDSGRHDDARAAFEAALQAKPGHRAALNNLGNLLKDTGDLAGAVACYRRILDAQPRDHVAHGNLIYTRQYQSGVSPAELLAEHRAWAAAHADPLTQAAAPHTNAPDPERPLRLGFVSADLREHVVARFLLPLLERHDRAAFQVHCYADVPRLDAMTARLREHVPVWRDIAGRADAEVAALIRADGIDVLVDLAAHTAGNRLLVFARRPAPVQATYLAYPGTTGMEAMDWRLTDPWLDPTDAPGGDTRYAERSHRLPATYWCYAAPAAAPEVGPLPAGEKGPVTFGCLNNFCKVTPETLALWAQLLASVPGSRLVLHAPAGATAARVAAQFTSADIAPDRIELVGRVAAAEYFRTYGRIDLALDPFPYTGGTTTCDALWMGVPVVSLAGAVAVHRGGASLLANAGLGELVATTPAGYLALARDLANDRPRLAGLRGALRERLRVSPLMDADRFTRDLESAWRTLWREWCARRGNS